MAKIPLLSQGWNVFKLWREVCHKRNHLRDFLKLSDHMLEDLGTSRVIAERELKRSLRTAEARRAHMPQEYPPVKKVGIRTNVPPAS